MAAPEPDPGPPEFVDIPDVAALSDTLETMSPPYRIGFSQGDGNAVAEFTSVDTSRGAGIAELHFDDGRHVTVDVETQVNGVAE